MLARLLRLLSCICKTATHMSLLRKMPEMDRNAVHIGGVFTT